MALDSLTDQIFFKLFKQPRRDLEKSRGQIRSRDEDRKSKEEEKNVGDEKERLGFALLLFCSGGSASGDW